MSFYLFAKGSPKVAGQQILPQLVVFARLDLFYDEFVTACWCPVRFQWAVNCQNCQMNEHLAQEEEVALRTVAVPLRFELVQAKPLELGPLSEQVVFESCASS